MSFAQAARRLAGQAAVMLGWPPDAFWDATPDDLGNALGGLAESAGLPGDARMDRETVARLQEMHPDG